MRSEELQYAGHGGESLSALLVLPEERPADGLPAVLLVHEVFGVDAHMRALAERLASAGYACLLPDLWAREGLPGPAPSAAEPAPEWPLATLRAAVQSLPDRRALADLDGALRALLDRPEIARSRVAALGFCMGGNLAFQLACTSREPLAAVVDYYGRIVYPEQTSAHPIQPLELALNLACPLLAHFGTRDPAITPEHVTELEERLRMFSREFEVVVHEGVGHGFQNETRPGYDGGAAERAWAQTLAFLHTHTTAN